jgi:cytochrome c-type biogenesis protein
MSSPLCWCWSERGSCGRCGHNSSAPSAGISLVELLWGSTVENVTRHAPCPVLAAILTYVMARQGGLVYGAALLFVYALGRGAQVVLAGTFAGVVKRLQAFGRWSSVIERASSIIIGVGLYFL